MRPATPAAASRWPNARLHGPERTELRRRVFWRKALVSAATGRIAELRRCRASTAPIVSVHPGRRQR
jgi:hypothetical protein